MQIACGIRVYFDKALRQILLYEQERDLCEKVCVGRFSNPPDSRSNWGHN